MMLVRVLAVLMSLGLFGMAQAEGTVADMHVEMGGCENCHASEAPEEVNAEHVYEQCAGCHGAPEEIEGEHHAIHGELFTCNDCHEVHDMAADAKPGCDNCHDDGRTP